MAYIKFYLSRKKSGTLKSIYCEVLMNQTIHRRMKTRLHAPVDKWSDKEQRCVIPKLRLATPEQREQALELTAVNAKLEQMRKDIEELLFDGFDEYRLLYIVTGRKPAEQASSFPEGLALYGQESKLSDGRKAHYAVVSRLAQRFSEYHAQVFTPSCMTLSDIMAFEDFVVNEHAYQDTEQYQVRVKSVQERPVTRRGRNRTVTIMKMVRAYFNQLQRLGKLKDNPFNRYNMPSETYGTPFYLTTDELRRVAEYPSRWPIQRDIFIFQCCVGCRISDMQGFTQRNLYTDPSGITWLSYIPQKTCAEKANVARVPLNDTALSIIARYQGEKEESLLPCISQPKYNDNIKRILEEAGIVRMVAVRNPKTGKSEQRRICDVASSHMARRCFCGGLYNSGVDTRVICTMSGHSDGSRSFRRYSTPTDTQLIQAIMNQATDFSAGRLP